MIKTKYEIRKAKNRGSLFPKIDLLPQIPHAGKQLDIALFGPKIYGENIKDMGNKYFHSKQLPIISFVPTTTKESISAVAYGFKDFAKPKIFNKDWLQIGLIVRAAEGFFANPPKDAKGNFIINEKTLRSYLNGTKSIRVNSGSVYIVPDNEALRDFGYAEYETFKQGVQEGREFAESGLAMVLEHTEEKPARHLGEISDLKAYKFGVDVWNFDNVIDPVLRVVGLGSSWGAIGTRLNVFDVGWDVDYFTGLAFGVLAQN